MTSSTAPLSYEEPANNSEESPVISYRCMGQGQELNLSSSQAEWHERESKRGKRKTEPKQKHVWPRWADQAGTGTMTGTAISVTQHVYFRLSKNLVFIITITTKYLSASKVKLHCGITAKL